MAIKQLRALLSANESSRFRFLREVTAAKRVPSFCTAQLLDADLADAQPYIVSEYIPGPSLEAVIRSEGPRSGTALDRIAVNTATALAGIHQAGIVHRDFKASNVLLGPHGPVVIDFGIAKALDVVDSSLTLPGHVAGTPGYLAPDQFEEGIAGPAVDIFAWGATITYAATGKLPFGSGPLPTVIYRILNEPPRLDGLTPALHGLVTACLEKDPAFRPTAREIVDHLLGREHLGGGPAGNAQLPTAGAVVPADVTTDRAVRSEGAGDTEASGSRFPDDPGPSLGGLPTMTADPVRAVAMHQRPRPADFGEPPAPATDKPTGARRVPVWAVIAAVVLLAAGAAAVKTLTGPSGGNSAVSALGTTSAAGTVRPSIAGVAGTQAHSPAGGPVSSSANATATSGNGTTVKKVSGTGTLPTAGPSRTSAPTPAAAPSQTAASTPPAAPSPKPTTSPSPSPAGTPNPYTPAEVCGSGYSVIDSHSLSGGTVYLLWSNSAGKNCVTTMRAYASGTIQMRATLQVEGGPFASDSGSYTYYAGPVALSAVATCVEWGGTIGSSSWTSGWSHCS